MTLQTRARAALAETNAKVEEENRRAAVDQWEKLRSYLVARVHERFDIILLDLSPTPPSTFLGWMRNLRHEETVDGIDFTFDVTEQGYDPNKTIVFRAYVLTKDGLDEVGSLAQLGQLLEDDMILTKEPA